MWFQDRGGCTVEDFCNHIHRSLVKDVKYVLAWGTSARHYPQHCGLSHVLQDEDVVQIVKKKVYVKLFLLVSSLMGRYYLLANSSWLLYHWTWTRDSLINTAPTVSMIFLIYTIISLWWGDIADQWIIFKKKFKRYPRVMEIVTLQRGMNVGYKFSI